MLLKATLLLFTFTLGYNRAAAQLWKTDKAIQEILNFCCEIAV